MPRNSSKSCVFLFEQQDQYFILSSFESMAYHEYHGPLVEDGRTGVVAALCAVAGLINVLATACVVGALVSRKDLDRLLCTAVMDKKRGD
jgi:hypothetical protein